MQPDLVSALRRVPPFNLQLIKLTWEVMGENGKLDPEKIIYNSKEIVEAIKEAEGYSQSTKEAVRWLQWLVRSRS